jgi:hypothetical protein
MNIFSTRKKTLLKHKEKNQLIVWFEGESVGNVFSARVVSKNDFYDFNYYSNNWKKENFEPLTTKNKINEYKKQRI